MASAWPSEFRSRNFSRFVLGKHLIACILACCYLSPARARVSARAPSPSPFTIPQILPFILVGIGVDDMFIITQTFRDTDKTLSVEERVAQGMKRW